MAEEILPEQGGHSEATLVYKIDKVDFKTFGVYVSKSTGIQDTPSLKEPQTVDWPDMHGIFIDMGAPRYNSREIELDCFIKADGKLDFFNKVRAFLQVFQKPGFRRLDFWIATKPLIYYVYLADGVEIDKQWHEGEMFGTFTLKLIDPFPIKRMLKQDGTQVNITLTSDKPVSIFWDVDVVTHDIMGEAVLSSHDYPVAGPHYPVIVGVIEEITNFTSNSDVIWNKY